MERRGRADPAPPRTIARPARAARLAKPNLASHFVLQEGNPRKNVSLMCTLTEVADREGIPLQIGGQKWF